MSSSTTSSGVAPRKEADGGEGPVLSALSLVKDEDGDKEGDGTRVDTASDLDLDAEGGEDDEDAENTSPYRIEDVEQKREEAAPVAKKTKLRWGFSYHMSRWGLTRRDLAYYRLSLPIGFLLVTLITILTAHFTTYIDSYKQLRKLNLQAESLDVMSFCNLNSDTANHGHDYLPCRAVGESAGKKTVQFQRLQPLDDRPPFRKSLPGRWDVPDLATCNDFPCVNDLKFQCRGKPVVATSIPDAFPTHAHCSNKDSDHDRLCTTSNWRQDDPPSCERIVAEFLFSDKQRRVNCAKLKMKAISDYEIKNEQGSYFCRPISSNNGQVMLQLVLSEEIYVDGVGAHDGYFPNDTFLQRGRLLFVKDKSVPSSSQKNYNKDKNSAPTPSFSHFPLLLALLFLLP